MKPANKAIIIILLFASCNSHKRTKVVLKTEDLGKEIIYQTEQANFHFDYQELIEYCRIEDDGEPNDFAFRDLIKYVESHPKNPVLIPDTIGTKLEKESEIYFNEGDSLIRVRDSKHPFAYVTDKIPWAIIKFTKQGKLRIFDKYSSSFAEIVIIEKVETDWYGATNIYLKNDTIVFSVLHWIR